MTHLTLIGFRVKHQIARYFSYAQADNKSISKDHQEWFKMNTRRNAGC